jgi:hypothetical protein
MTAGPRVAFLTHDGPAVGLGHVARCLGPAGALATRWRPGRLSLMLAADVDVSGAGGTLLEGWWTGTGRVELAKRWLLLSLRR